MVLRRDRAIPPPSARDLTTLALGGLGGGRTRKVTSSSPFATCMRDVSTGNGVARALPDRASLSTRDRVARA
eukprot:227334-Rhodomonas_salina.1